MFRIVLISSLLAMSLASPMKRQTSCPCSPISLLSADPDKGYTVTPTAVYNADCSVTVTCETPDEGIDMKANCNATNEDEVTYAYNTNNPVTATYICVSGNYQFDSSNPNVGTPGSPFATNICCHR
uniref:Uncharacterized protein n=1 Tax=Acrobeloides nanus TaxID=290746 RepID=A0A914DR60_9BILA